MVDGNGGVDACRPLEGYAFRAIARIYVIVWVPEHVKPHI